MTGGLDRRVARPPLWRRLVRLARNVIRRREVERDLDGEVRAAFTFAVEE
jgi:hypothetical protein